MNGDEQVLAAAEAWAGQPMALATVVTTWGSAPRAQGSHMLVHADGRFEGSVSGGCVEADILQTASEVIADGAFRIRRYGLADENVWEAGLPCGGEIVVMVQPVTPDGFDPWLFEVVAEERRRGRTVEIRTDLETGRSRIAAASGSASDEFVNRYAPPRRLLIVGAVQIAQTLVEIGRAMGFGIVLIDPRLRFLTPERFPGATLDDRWPDEAIEAHRPDSQTGVVTLSHDPKIDDPALAAALRLETGYIGALGSHRSHEARCRRLLAMGVAPSQVARVEGPAGAPIGAVGPSEIALSIMAGLIARLRRHA